ncbi:MAG: class I SAM-dependent methyltransferase, partial [Alphaproteobacteria bacterium]|nr:class I SAM-dependent methyltransferase [Alphaproteobacteria bacterium]
DDVEGQRLVGAGLSLLALDPAVRAALATGEPGRLPGSAPPLLLALLERTIVAERQWERVLTRLRAALLADFRSLDDPRAPLVRALAAQMLATDYAYAVSEAEAATVAGLSTDGADLSADLVRRALYVPLGSDAVGTEAPPDWTAFVERHIRRPAAERTAAAAIPSLTDVEDAVSQAVQAQYTALPYPRWLATRATEPRPRLAVLRAILPEAARPAGLRDPKPLRVLVAGCGTGKHAVDVATRFADADVLAIDLSRPSLGYARAQAERLGIANVRFAQADILRLGEIRERFDHIEAMGVLHHLGEPLAGWRVLAELLTAGGTMRVGLYARRGRAAIQTAQRLAADFGTDADGLRALRQAILALPPDHPAAAVAEELDFYTLNGVRDALAHAQEHDFTPRELQALLADLKFAFLGFETVSQEPQRLYRTAFPDDPTLADLANWDALEQQHPSLFHHMYQFWCRKP